MARPPQPDLADSEDGFILQVIHIHVEETVQWHMLYLKYLVQYR
jgi:hypothetical protein